jgi:hypothetical protein
MNKYGYFFIDSDEGRVYKCNRQGTLETINEGLNELLKERLRRIPNYYDNPFTQMGLTMGFDVEYDRLIISLVEYVPTDYTEELMDLSSTETNYVYIGTDNFYYIQDDFGNKTKLSFLDSTYFTPRMTTISFSFSRNGWIFFHDYFPNIMFDNRNGLYSASNINKNIYKHNDKTKNGIYYDSEPKPFFLDISIKGERNDMDFVAAMWLSDVYNKTTKVNIWDEPFTHIMIYNENQCSGVLPIKYLSDAWFEDNTKKVGGKWSFNSFRDMLVDSKAQILDDNFEVITSNIDANKDWFNQSFFRRDYVIIRLIHDNLSQNDVYLHEVTANQNLPDIVT